MDPPPQYTGGDVPTAVSSLLAATKQLQDALTRWSIGQATETEVSDIFVQIGTLFNATNHAFLYHKIDLKYVPYPSITTAIATPSISRDPSIFSHFSYFASTLYPY
jgi:hypothetical protein